MDRRNFLIKNILAAGYVALNPILDFTNFHNKPEYFIYTQSNELYYGVLFTMKMVYKENEYRTSPTLIKSLDEPCYSHAIQLHKNELIKISKCSS